LAVGRLGRVKDYPTLIRAFAKLRENREVRLVILGEGNERSRLESLVRELKLQDCVKMPGYVSNPFAYMARASLFALTSLREGLSNVLVEALYCGCPAVATDCPVGPREVLRGGEYGRLVPVGDDNALAQAMLESLDSKPPSDVCSLRYEMQSVVDQYAAALLAK
jgi:glycosyltransferase involved in cell wall biosynthesis